MKNSKIKFSFFLFFLIGFICLIVQCAEIKKIIYEDVPPEPQAVIDFLKAVDYANNEDWQLFPGMPDTPESDSLKRLGLPVHGRWVRTYVNSIANDYLKKAVNPDLPFPLEFPPGSFIVKENYRSNFSSTLDTINRDSTTLGVITVLYKPSPKFNYCATDHLKPYNGSDCYGGGWFYGFFFTSDKMPGFQESLDDSVQANVNSFCINCHAPAFKTDYVRTLDNIRAPFANKSNTPYCDAFQPDQQMPNPDALKVNDSADLQTVLNAVQNYIQSSTLSPELPGDVPNDPSLVFKHLGPEATQKMFDVYAWQSFIALNWPNKGPNPNPPNNPQRGEPDRNLPFTANSDRPVVWETYKPTFEVFQPGNTNWNPVNQPWNQRRPEIVGKNCQRLDDEMVLTMGSKARDVANETGQAFAGTFGYLVDQDSVRVRYEVLFNRTEFEYIIDEDRASTLNLTPGGPKGQLTKIDFPDNRDDVKYKTGSIEVKSAWKKLCLDNSCKQRDALNLSEAKKKFFVRNVLVFDEGRDSCWREDMALVGLHIARKTYYAPQWIWITFEHKDNVPDDGNIDPNANYTFYNQGLPEPEACWQYPFLFPKPEVAACPNVDLNRFVDELRNAPNQLTRLVPIDNTAQTVNEQFQNELRKIGSPFANYILVNAQWPLNGRQQNGEVSKFNCKDNTLEASGTCFKMVPRFLRNSVIESYMSGYCNVAGEISQESNRSCMSCHGSAGNDLSYIWLDAVSQRVKLKQD